MVQLYETMLTRHTSMVVGPTGGGKSVVINTLCQAQTRYGVVGCVVRVGIGRGQLSYKVGGVVGDNRCTCYIRNGNCMFVQPLLQLFLHGIGGRGIRVGCSRYQFSVCVHNYLHVHHMRTHVMCVQC